MGKPFEIGPDDDEIIKNLESNIAQFLRTYSAASGVNYWSLMLMLFDISAGALGQVDHKATASLLDATAKMTKAQRNLPAQVDVRRKAMFRLLERGDFLTSPPKGSA